MSFLVLLVPFFSKSPFSPFQAIERVKSQCSHCIMSTILVPISVAEGLLLVPFSLKIWSPFGPLFEKFRFPFHVGAVPPPQIFSILPISQIGDKYIGSPFLMAYSLPYISVLGLYIRLQTYTLPIYRPQISFSSPRNKYVAKFGIYSISLLSHNVHVSVTYNGQIRERKVQLELPQFTILKSVDKVLSFLINLHEGSNSQFGF